MNAGDTSRSLAELLAAHGTVAPGETMRILAEVADALDYGHGKQTAHGNLNTQQIRIGENGAVQLTGWPAESVTADAETVVTTPDSAFNETRADADVLALAAVGHQCLTGHAPDPAAPIPPLPPHIPPAVTQVITLALRDDSDARIPSAARFARSCRDAAAGLGLTTQLPAVPVPGATMPMRSPQPAASSPAPPRRRGLLMAGLVSVVALAAVGVLLAVIQPWSGPSGALADTGSSAPGQAGNAGSAAAAKNSKSPGDAETGKSSSPGDPKTTADSGDNGGHAGDNPEGGDDYGGKPGGDPTSDDIYSGPMPDVVGMTVADAYAAIVTEAYVQTDVNYSSSDPICIVESQYPSAGTHIDEGSNPGITASGSPADCGF